MLFAHDTERELSALVAMVNTVGHVSGEEGLPDVEALDAFCEEHRWSGRRDHDLAELESVRSLRPRLLALWDLALAGDEAGFVELVNTLLSEGRALPQLVRHDGWDWHLHATPDDAPLDRRMAVEAGMAMVEVVRRGELGRLQRCAGEDCTDVFVDLSKNRSRRFCDGSCGNRAAVAAYRARMRG
ncbi:CGNR zinc finger domain-containing protein [Quadrisphaera setariae]|uniref:RNA-binding protein n=1 Tax=Quadrisphaera setariae TaxID=2593304 RepID=A0A5C8Z788_9ACTN|nr:CGNR zinc finger domain-containing protein [Quadrisphaera setariae]TXR52726.1 RNA-binding protein [Quadrisphaera setariae]